MAKKLKPAYPSGLIKTYTAHQGSRSGTPSSTSNNNPAQETAVATSNDDALKYGGYIASDSSDELGSDAEAGHVSAKSAVRHTTQVSYNDIIL